MSTLPKLDNTQVISSLDNSNMLGSLLELDKQIAETWEQTSHINFAPTAEITSVVFAGMGGSGLGGHLIRSVFLEELTLPVMQVNGYTLPGHVDQHTLVVLSSYSGTTEEVLSCANEAQGRGAQLAIITSGGTLLELARQHNIPHFHIQPSHNPSNQPRMALGYSVFGTVGLLQAAGLFTLSDDVVEQTISVVNEQIQNCRVENSDNNRAKLIAYLLIDRFPLFVGPDFLAGALHTATNQHNENAKVLAHYHLIPELNHHLLEGLQFPKLLSSSHVAILAESHLAQERNQQRLTLTEEIFSQAGIETYTLGLTGNNKLAQNFELITIMGFAGFYLSMLEDIDPSPIPQVESFKKKLQ